MSGHGQHVQRTEDDFGRALAHDCIVQCVAHGPLQTTQEGDGGGGVRLGPVRQHDVGVRREHRHLGIPGSGALHTSQRSTRLTGIIHHPRRLFMAPYLQRAGALTKTQGYAYSITQYSLLIFIIFIIVVIRRCRHSRLQYYHLYDYRTFFRAMDRKTA